MGCCFKEKDYLREVFMEYFLLNELMSGSLRDYMFPSVSICEWQIVFMPHFNDINISLPQ